MNVITNVLWYFVKYKWLEFIESFLSMWNGERYGIFEEKAFTSLMLKITQRLRENETGARARCVWEREREIKDKERKESVWRCVCGDWTPQVSVKISSHLSHSSVYLSSVCMLLRKRLKLIHISVETVSRSYHTGMSTKHHFNRHRDGLRWSTSCPTTN